MAGSNFPAPNNNINNSIAYINGRVFTVNSRQPWAEAFIVDQDGKFLTVGSSAEILTQAVRDHIVTFDLRDHFIMPGIHDAHVHLLMSAMASTSQIRLPGQGLTNENLAEELRKGKCLCKYGHANQDWLVGHTYLVDGFDRKVLDQEFPETPVVVRGGAGHSAFVNSEALRRSGYDIEGEEDSQGTHFVRDEKGHLTGELAENALDKVMRSLPQPNVTHVKRVLKGGQKMLHRAGVTSCQEASANTLMLTALRELEAEGDLKLDIQTHIVYAPDWIGEEHSSTLHQLIDNAGTFRSPHVNTRFVKIILDGVPLEPYYTHAGFTTSGEVDESKLFILRSNLFSAVREYDSRGMTLKIHCTGHGATRLALDAISAARKANPGSTTRHEIAHCSGVHEDEYARFKGLNVTAEMSPAFFFTHPITKVSGGLMDWDFARMRAADAHVTIGSDWGAGADPDILPCMAGIVEAVGGGEKLCRILTLAGAEAVGQESIVGSIEVGKKANFIAVSKALAKGEFEGVEVLTTWFEGEIVYEKSGVYA